MNEPQWLKKAKERYHVTGNSSRYKFTVNDKGELMTIDFSISPLQAGEELVIKESNGNEISLLAK